MDRCSAAQITHGRHCPCSACAREDWTKIEAPCGMHGASCPREYQPVSSAATPQRCSVCGETSFYRCSFVDCPLPEAPSAASTFRESMIAATMKQRGCDRAEAEVILDRVADRLAGFSHEEVAEMHPLPRAES